MDKRHRDRHQTEMSGPPFRNVLPNVTSGNLCADLDSTAYHYCTRCTWLGQPATFHIGQSFVRALSATHQPFSPSQRTMSQTQSIASHSSGFQSVLNAALEAYEKKTKCKLLTHPLAARVESCNSPTAILSVLQDLVQQFDQRRRSDERLTNWLNPTVNVLYAFSSTLGQGVGLVSLNSLSSWNL